MMVLKNINDDYKRCLGADFYYNFPSDKDMKLTNNVRDILFESDIIFSLIEIIEIENNDLNEDFLIWSLDRVIKNDMKTDSFKLTCYVENEIQFLKTFKNLENVKFDTLKMYFENNVLFLPEER